MCSSDLGERIDGPKPQSLGPSLGETQSFSDLLVRETLAVPQQQGRSFPIRKPTQCRNQLLPLFASEHRLTGTAPRPNTHLPLEGFLKADVSGLGLEVAGAGYDQVLEDSPKPPLQFLARPS